MKRTLQILLLILTFNSCGFSQKEQTKIPRTKVSISIPDGYSIMSANTGLQKDNNQAIMIMDLVGGNYYTNAKDFNKRTFELQGMTVYSFEETIIDGFPAKVMTTNTDDENLSSIMVVFGDTTFSTMMTSIHRANDKKLENHLKKVMLAVKYDKEIAVDPFEGVNFKIDTVTTKFKFGVFSSNMYVFTPFGQDNPKEKSMVMLTPSMFDKTMTIEQVSQMATNGLKKHGMYGFITDSTAHYQIEGADALLKIGDCYAGVENMYYHQLILAKKDLVLMIYGMCDNKDEEMKIEISKFCDLIRIKN